jgi:hypothetical protein
VIFFGQNKGIGKIFQEETDLKPSYPGLCGALLVTIDRVAMTSRDEVVALLKEYLREAVLLKDSLTSEALM